MEYPRHLGIIMDGNRRFAKKIMESPHMGHEWGAKKLAKALVWCREYGIKELTVYTFSVQNFNRPKKEFDHLMKIFVENFDKLKDDERIYKNRIKVNVIGRLWMFPQVVQDKLSEIMDRTKDHDNYIMNFAMAYGGQEELVDAAKKIAQQVKDGLIKVDDIDNNVLRHNLYLESEPDLIIRTGGEQRTSNFLPYQGVYSEYIFLDKNWPEFEKEDFENCMKEYSNRKRRFGK